MLIGGHSFDDLTYEQVSGRGVIYSWERSWYPVHPALAERLPYIVVLVELLDAGNVRMVGNLLGDPGQEVPISADVEAVFEDHEPPRECWRLQSLRGWSDDTTRQIPSGDPRAGGPDGVRARAGPLVAVGNDQLDRLEVRDDAGDVTEVGATG